MRRIFEAFVSPKLLGDARKLLRIVCVDVFAKLLRFSSAHECRLQTTYTRTPKLLKSFDTAAVKNQVALLTACGRTQLIPRQQKCPSLRSATLQNLCLLASVCVCVCVTWARDSLRMGSSNEVLFDLLVYIVHGFRLFCQARCYRTTRELVSCSS